MYQIRDEHAEELAALEAASDRVRADRRLRSVRDEEAVEAMKQMKDAIKRQEQIRNMYKDLERLERELDPRIDLRHKMEGADQMAQMGDSAAVRELAEQQKELASITSPTLSSLLQSPQQKTKRTKKHHMRVPPIRMFI